MHVSFKRLAPLAACAAIAAAALMHPQVWADQPAGERPRGSGGQPGGQPGGGGGPRGQAPSVEGGMRMLNRGANQLKATIADPAKRDENLQAIWMMQRGCLGAKAAKPEHTKGDPAQTLDTFRRGQIKLMAMLLDLETAILDGKNADAQAIFAKVAAHRDASHTALGVEEDEHEEGGGAAGGSGGGGGAGGGGG